jgi:F420H(2)-dependent quinone reductase
VPAGDHIAVIGTSFGQPRTPAWYHHMRADPKAEVTYRNKKIKAIAREAGDEERQAIWGRARTIYAGYEAYASRITNRQIHIMILSAENSGDALREG